LLDSNVLIVGLGGLGSPVALYLAGAGVGTLGLVDPEPVELSNLHRQVVHGTADLGRPKVDSARERLKQLNDDVTVHTYHEAFSPENARRLVGEYDFVVEGTDDFDTKYLVNDACVLTDTAYSIAGILRFEGQTITHVPGSASYRCAYPAPPEPGTVPTCAEAGVFGVIAGMLGTIQAAEAVKYLAGLGELLTDTVLMFDALSMEFRRFRVPPTDCARVAEENSRIRTL
jgi:adenylyltransferase/sulfurtransferase